MNNAEKLDEVLEDVQRRRGGGERIPDSVVIGRHPDLMPELGVRLAELARVDSAQRRAADTFTLGEDRSPAANAIPESIGRYTIRRVIASGGMGTVYEAEQVNPRRAVAVKVMKQGVTSRSALRRFEFESQLLAHLRHPAVAQVYEAGIHQEGDQVVPYFAMEYIPNARTLTDFAREKKLKTRDKISLFIKVCEAVHHGHQKGVIHRDLKPGNILVDTNGQPKVIDFGVARATDSDLAVSTLHTDVGQLIGTLQYMSPEQCKADPNEIDTRSDVYALGVVLYELLTGQLPYRIAGVPIYEATRMIRENQPATPSSHDRALRGDLETIVIKALEKERERRYQSASALTADLRRYLNSEPISARPPSVTYQVRVFARRNKGLVAGMALAFLTLVMGVITSTTLFFKAKTEARLAQVESEKSRQVATFMTDMLQGVGPSVALGRDTTLLREILDTTAKRVGDELGNQPEVGAELRLALGSAYRQIGDYSTADEHLSRANEVLQGIQGTEHLDVATSQHSLARLRVAQGRYAEAKDLYERALALRRRLLGAENPRTADTIHCLGCLEHKAGDYERAESLIKEALNIRRRRLGPHDPNVAYSLRGLANLYFDLGALGDAKTMYEEALEIIRRHNDVDGPDALRLLSKLAALHRAQGELDEAEKRGREVLSLSKQLYGERHPSFANAAGNLGSTLYERGQYAEAEELQRTALTVRRESLGNVHPYVADALNKLANTLSALDKKDEAASMYREALETRRGTLGNDHVFTATAMANLGKVLVNQGKYSEAEPLLQEALTIAKAALGDKNHVVAQLQSELGVLYQNRGEYASAEAAFRESLALFRNIHEEGHPEIARQVSNLAGALHYQEKYAEAEPLQRESLAITVRKLGEKHPQTAVITHNLAGALMKLGRLAEAAELFERAIDIMREAIPAGHWYTGAFLGNYGECLMEMERYEDAEAVLLEAHDLLMKKLGPDHDRTQKIAAFLADLYERWGKPEEAVQWIAHKHEKQAE
ncbi:MAG: tetratricopeptide repeat protein [Phycisphaerae bacterium]|jgi:serine/threonine protein kinase/Tfp pilus assembly protein PilF